MNYDITGKICPLYPGLGDRSVPMYSFDSPSFAVWGTIANTLHERGWSEARIIEWLQSKNARWSMDGELGDALRLAAKQFADSIGDDPR